MTPVGIEWCGLVSSPIISHYLSLKWLITIIMSHELTIKQTKWPLTEFDFIAFTYKVHIVDTVQRTRSYCCLSVKSNYY